MQSSEIELKFPVSDPAALQSLLPRLGFRLDTPRTFEQNTLYDTPTRTLRQDRQLLRLRQYGTVWTVTHKRQPDQQELAESTRYKVRIETETQIEDGPAMAEVFARIGYTAVFRYEKFRTEWSHPLTGSTESSPTATGHLVLDETPIGTYAELEGPMDWIDRTLAELEIDAATCLTESYGRLFLTWKERTGSVAENLTFEEVNNAILIA